MEDGIQSSKVHVLSIRNKPSIKPTAIVFSSSERNQICVAEITGEIHLMTMVTDGLSVTADIIRSVSVGVNSMFGVACEKSVEFYLSSSADAGGLFLVNFPTGHCERVLSNGSESLKQVYGPRFVQSQTEKLFLWIEGPTKSKKSMSYPNK